MAILDTLKKGYILLKTTSGYVKLLPKTLAKLVEMEDGTNVEDAIAKLSKKLTANRALISNASGAVAVSPVTATELKYLDGVRGNIQTQIDNKNSLKGKNGDNMIQFLWNANMTCTLYVDGTRIGNLNYTK